MNGWPTEGIPVPHNDKTCSAVFSVFFSAKVTQIPSSDKRGFNKDSKIYGHVLFVSPSSLFFKNLNCVANGNVSIFNITEVALALFCIEITRISSMNGLGNLHIHIKTLKAYLLRIHGC